MGFSSYCLSLSRYIMSSYLRHYSVLYELNTLDAFWIAVDVWSNSSRCRQESVYLTRTWCLYFIIISLDIIITLRFSINCSTVICSPIVLFAFKRETSSETYGPRVYLPHYIFQYIYIKNTKNTLLHFIYIYFNLHFSNILYLSLLDLTFASDRERIDNPFIALGASIWLFV